ncbi:MAG: PBSX family phage terminase large subunit [Sporolactobacillus sp.]
MAMKNKNIFHFQPFSRKQLQLLTWWMPESPVHTYDGIIAEGTIRSGKTISMIDSFITWSQASFEGQSFIVGGKTVAALTRNVLEPMFQILNAKGIPFRYVRAADERHIVIGSNTYYLFGGNNERSQDVVQGLTAAGAYLDEAVLMPKSFVNQVTARCSIDGAKYFFNCNPGPPKHWIKMDIIDKKNERNVAVLHFTMDDNLSLSQDVKDRLARQYSGVFYRRFILGQWVAATGIVYDMFDEKKHVISRETIRNMIHNNDFHSYIAGVDWGITSPMVGLIYGLTRDHKAVEVAEFYKTHQQTQDLVRWFKMQETDLGKQIRVIFCDSAETDRIIDLRKEGLRAKAGAKGINAGINTCMTMFKNDRILINEDCRNTINELLTYAYPEPDDPKAKQDLPLDENNHAMDAQAYCLRSYFRVRK